MSTTAETIFKMYLNYLVVIGDFYVCTNIPISISNCRMQVETFMTHVSCFIGTGQTRTLQNTHMRKDS